MQKEITVSTLNTYYAPFIAKLLSTMWWDENSAVEQKEKIGTYVRLQMENQAVQKSNDENAKKKFIGGAFLQNFSLFKRVIRFYCPHLKITME